MARIRSCAALELSGYRYGSLASLEIKKKAKDQADAKRLKALAEILEHPAA